KKPPCHALFEGPTVSLASAAAVSGARSPPLPAKRSTGVQTLGERRFVPREIVIGPGDPTERDSILVQAGRQPFSSQTTLFAPSPLTGPERWGSASDKLPPTLG